MEISDVIKNISRKLEQPMVELLQALSPPRTSSLFETYDSITGKEPLSFFMLVLLRSVLILMCVFSFLFFLFFSSL